MLKRVIFKNNKNQKLMGIINLPSSKPPFPAVVICHGFKGYKEQMHLKFMSSIWELDGGLLRDMILIINTADQKRVFIGLINKDKLVAKKEFVAQYQQAEKLLTEIDRLLANQVCKLASLQTIIVVNGPGPFTALRIGVVTANTLAWALNIPVAGIKLTEFKNLEELVEISKQKIKKTKIGAIAEPFYDQKPNITLKK